MHLCGTDIVDRRRGEPVEVCEDKPHVGPFMLRKGPHRVKLDLRIEA
jgi:hypothetical protein